MARHLKKLNNYPKQFFHLIEQAQREGGMFIPVEGDTMQETKNLKISLRSQLYSFFAAIRKEAEEWENIKGDKGTIWATKHVRFAEQTAVRAEEGGLRLISKNDTPMAGLLGKALELSREKLGMESWEVEEDRGLMETAERDQQILFKKLGIVTGEEVEEKKPGWDTEIGDRMKNERE